MGRTVSVGCRVDTGVAVGTGVRDTIAVIVAVDLGEGLATAAVALGVTACVSRAIIVPLVEGKVGIAAPDCGLQAATPVAHATTS